VRLPRHCACVNAGSDAVGGATSADDEVTRLVAEQGRLQAEVDDLRAELAAVPRKRAVRSRGVVAVVLVVLTSIVVTVSVTAV
jgi:hypothetical protein